MKIKQETRTKIAYCDDGTQNQEMKKSIPWMPAADD